MFQRLIVTETDSAISPPLATLAIDTESEIHNVAFAAEAPSRIPAEYPASPMLNPAIVAETPPVDATESDTIEDTDAPMYDMTCDRSPCCTHEDATADLRMLEPEGALQTTEESAIHNEAWHPLCAIRAVTERPEIPKCCPDIVTAEMAVDGTDEVALTTIRTAGFKYETAFVIDPFRTPTDKTTPKFLPVPRGTRL